MTWDTQCGADWIVQVTAWIPLMCVTPDTGCLQLLRGGHRSGRTARHTAAVGDTWWVGKREEAGVMSHQHVACHRLTVQLMSPGSRLSNQTPSCLHVAHAIYVPSGSQRALLCDQHIVHGGPDLSTPISPLDEAALSSYCCDRQRTSRASFCASNHCACDQFA